jgi:hypothetical protein
MKKRTCSSLFVALFLILGVSMFLSTLSLGLAAQTPPSTTLSNDDCIKCHAIRGEGGKLRPDPPKRIFETRSSPRSTPPYGCWGDMGRQDPIERSRKIFPVPD